MLLDRYVILQSKTETIDSEGIVIETWTTLSTIRANKQEKSSKIIILDQPGYTDANIDFVYFTKVNTSIVEGLRIVDGADTFIITKIKKYINHYEVVVESVV